MVTKLLTARLTALIVGAVSVAGCQESWEVPETPELTPLREVARSAQPPKSVFDRPALVLIMKIAERSEIEQTTFEGESLVPPRHWGAVKAAPLSIIRLNERKKADPDLSRGVFMIEQRERAERPLRFEFGTYYLVLLNPSTILKGAPAMSAPIDWYSLAVPQGGFSIINGRLRPIVDGGELDAFRGRSADDVIKEIQAAGK